MRNSVKSVSILALLVLLAACELRLNEHVMRARADQYQDFRAGNRVDLVQYSHDVSFSGGANRPSKSELSKLDAFTKGIQLGYQDDVTLRGSSPKRRMALQAHLQRKGLPIRIRTESGDGNDVKSNTVKVTVERYVVTPPACPNWSNFDGNEQRNTPGSNYGCATDSSLGYMIANPKDLIEGQSIGPAFGKPSVDAQRRYQAGKVKSPASTATGGL